MSGRGHFQELSPVGHFGGPLVNLLDRPTKLAVITIDGRVTQNIGLFVIARVAKFDDRRKKIKIIK